MIEGSLKHSKKWVYWKILTLFDFLNVLVFQE